MQTGVSGTHCAAEGTLHKRGEASKDMADRKAKGTSIKLKKSQTSTRPADCYLDRLPKRGQKKKSKREWQIDSPTTARVAKVQTA